MDTTAARETTGPGLLDALGLLAEVADQLVVRTVRDTHEAWTDRVHGLLGHGAHPAGLADRLHRGIAGAVYGGLGAGLRTAGRGLDRVAATGAGPRLEDDPRGRFLSAAVNGLIGDRLERERPQLAIPMAVRVGGRDVRIDRPSLVDAFPEPSPRVAVLLHGLCEDESQWDRGRARLGTTYRETLAELGWTPVLLRANTGLGLRENGVALASLLQHLVESWPVEVSRIALVGHSMGGLVMRAAGAVAAQDPTGAHGPGSEVEGDGEKQGGRRSARPWTSLVSDVVTLGTPHLGAPAARGVGHGSRGLARLPETSAFGRILDWRSQGVHDLVAGLAEDVPPMPRARYHLVAATVTRSARHPVGRVVGDLLVQEPSACGRDPHGHELFPGADLLHVGGSGHFGLLNHPDVHRALRDWLGARGR